MQILPPPPESCCDYKERERGMERGRERERESEEERGRERASLDRPP